MTEKTASKPEEPFDWMKFIKLHPLVVAGSLLVSGAAGGVAGYLAFGSFITTKVSNELEAQKEKFKGDKGDDGMPGDPAAFPPGAIVAFDLKSGCPETWSNVGKEQPNRFAGRAIIVAGPDAIKERKKGQETQARAYGEQGGYESLTLTKEELPSHTHPLAYETITGENLKFHEGDIGKNIPAFYRPDLSNQKISDVNNGVPPTKNSVAKHENMPPYIALHFCKKL